MKGTIKTCLITALSLLSFTAYADITGTYQCTRTDAANSATTYPLSIKATGTTYTLEWDNSNGYPAMYGTGVMHPNNPNMISVAFLDQKDADNYGVELFNVNTDGSLSSNWAVQSTNQVGTETCTKSK